MRLSATPHAPHYVILVKMAPVVKRNCRRYGGALDVPDPFPTEFSMQLIDIRIVDNVEEISSYDTKALTSTNFHDLLNTEADDVFFGEQKTITSSRALLFGRTIEGYSVCATVEYNPFLYIILPTWITQKSQCQFIADNIAQRLSLESSQVRFEVNKRANLYGFTPNPKNPLEALKRPVMKIYVPNLAIYGDLLKKLRKISRYEKGFRIQDVSSSPIQFELAEWKVDHIHKFCDDNNITTSDWVHIKAYDEPIGYVSHAQIECIVDRKNMAHIERPDMAPFLVASVDCEMYDPNYAFPNSKIQSNAIITIGTVLWRFGNKVVEKKTPEELQREIEAIVDNTQEKLQMIRTPQEKIDSELNAIRANPKVDPDKKVCVMERYVFTLKSCHVVPHTTVFQFDDECEMLNAWRDFISVHADPDIVTGYNIIGFDFEYMSDRALCKWKQFPQTQPLATQQQQQTTQNEEELLQLEKEWLDALNSIKPTKPASANEDDDEINDDEVNSDDDDDDKKCDDDDDEEKEQTKQKEQKEPQRPSSQPTEQRFFYLSRIWSRRCDLDTRIFVSNAYGESRNHYFNMWGRVTLDLLVYVKREYKLESYKLDFVSRTYLKDWKIDLPYKLMFRYFEMDSTKRALIADYCVKDCELPIRLIDYFSTIPNLVGMSKITYTQITDIMERGQQIKVYNQLLWDAHRAMYVANDPPPGRVDEFVGATVIEPVVGWYTQPVAVGDFASLYPSIMRDQNLCYSTYIMNKDDPLIKKIPPQYINKVVVSPDKEHWFINHIKGVLPTLEERLLNARKNVRKEMKTAKGDHWSILNGRQLAIKISCNSVFGFTGAGKGMYSCKPIAESITARGRYMINKTQDTIVEMFPGTKIVYGDTDSVMVVFPVPPGPEGIRESFRMGNEATKKVTSLFSDAVGLELEKVYCPYLLFNKKRYAALMYENPELPSKLDTKGIEVVRRDSSLMTRKVFKQMLKQIFYNLNPLGAVSILQAAMLDIVQDRCPLDMFVLSKSLKGTYSNPAAQPHVAVVQKIAKRAPGTEPKVGDRVPFVVVQNLYAKHLSDKTEDPEYVKKNKIPLDKRYYIEKQLQSPLTKLLVPFLGSERKVDEIFEPYFAVIDRVARNNRSLDEFFSTDSPQSTVVHNRPITIVEPQHAKRKESTVVDLFGNVVDPAALKKKKKPTTKRAKVNPTQGNQKLF